MPHDTEPLAVLRVRSPGDLIDLIPYLLGFHPRSSLVLVGLHDGRVAATARADLADIAAGQVPLSDTIQLIVRGEADQLVAAIYDDRARLGGDGSTITHGDTVHTLGRLADSAGLRLVEALLVARGRWRSYLCDDEQCCPPNGIALAGDSSVAAATATYAGLVALPDRGDVTALLDPFAIEQREALEPLIVHYENSATAAILDGRSQSYQRSLKRALFAAARDADRALFPGQSGSVPDEDVCRFAVALVDTPIRDAVWLATERRQLDGRALWREIARRAPQPYDAAPLFLFGWVCWRDGNGVLAALAAERALASDPGYRAADLLLGAVRHGLDPRRTPRLRLPRSA
jgi:uncharacterized protein DUF4192